jgi:hypothetical protein
MPLQRLKNLDIVLRTTRPMRHLPSGRKDLFYYTAWKLVDLQLDVEDYRRHQVRRPVHL